MLHFLARAFGRRQDSGPAPEPGSGLIVPPRMDPRLRRICAIHADGRVEIAAGFEADREVRQLLVGLRRDGVLLDDGQEVSVSLEAVAQRWAEAGQSQAGAQDLADPVIAGRTGRLLAQAAEARASDIVLEISGDIGRASLIVNDRKRELAQMPAEHLREVTGLLFHCKEEGSAQTSYQRVSFQGFSVRPGGTISVPRNVTGLRCQRGPHEPDGDHLFIRLFYRDQIAAGTTLSDLGFLPQEEEIFAEIRASLHGGIFLGGSTGDGKSTTLAVNLTLQQQEADGQLNLVTVEDPVEYPIPGAIQIAVPTTGSGDDRADHFIRALMHFCRIHPAAGMVSEIRDADAARQVLQFIDTGHQVWTTIHVHSANAILFRLLDMGVETAEVCKPGNIKLLMKQTLIPELCDFCAFTDPPQELPEWLRRQLPAGVRYRNPEGCPACRDQEDSEIKQAAWAGYTGQQALAEMIQPDAGYLDFVRARDAAGAWNYWVEELQGTPLSDRILRMVSAGRADPWDALRKGARIRDAKQRLEVIEGAVA